MEIKTEKNCKTLMIHLNDSTLGANPFEIQWEFTLKLVYFFYFWRTFPIAPNESKPNELNFTFDFVNGF